MKPFLIMARKPENFEHQVKSVLGCGYAIDNALFVADGLLCQWVKPMPNYYEWKLAVGVSLGDLQAEVQKYWAEGFDFLYNPLAHESENVFVQWVQKWKVSSQLSAFSIQEEQKLLEGVTHELKLVEDVQPVKLVVGDSLFSSWEINPFTRNFGGSHE
jgi:hypothetical protein